jgi:hypothetical protein
MQLQRLEQLTFRAVSPLLQTVDLQTRQVEQVQDLAAAEHLRQQPLRAAMVEQPTFLELRK